MNAQTVTAMLKNMNGANDGMLISMMVSKKPTTIVITYAISIFRGVNDAFSGITKTTTACPCPDVNFTAFAAGAAQ